MCLGLILTKRSVEADRAGIRLLGLEPRIVRIALPDRAEYTTHTGTPVPSPIGCNAISFSRKNDYVVSFVLGTRLAKVI